MPCCKPCLRARTPTTCCTDFSQVSRVGKAPPCKAATARAAPSGVASTERTVDLTQNVQRFTARGLPAVLTLSQAWAANAATKAADTLADSMAAEGIVPVDPSNYVPSPVEVGWEIYFGAFAGAFPFAIGLYEFTKRIMIQRRCEVCNGTGLVVAGSRQLEVKCPQCGGFFPWRSWREFLSANARPGNGGVLRFPKGQTSVFYSVPDKSREKSDTESTGQTREEDERSEESAPTDRK